MESKYDSTKPDRKIISTWYHCEHCQFSWRSNLTREYGQYWEEDTPVCPECGKEGVME